MSDFNLKGLVLLYDTETKAKLSINTWVGKMFITIFFDGDTKPYSTQVNDHALYLLKKFIGDTIKSANPIKKSIILSEWNNAGDNKWTRASTITIARNEKRMITIELSNNNFPSSVKFVTFEFNTPKSINIEDPDIANFDDIKRSEFGARTFLSSLTDYISVAKIASRDANEMAKSFEEYKKKRQNGYSNNNSSTNNNTNKDSDDDDIPF